MPKRRYRKGSKYDPILDAFLEGKNNLVTVEVPGRNGAPGTSLAVSQLSFPLFFVCLG